VFGKLQKTDLPDLRRRNHRFQSLNQDPTLNRSCLQGLRSENKSDDTISERIQSEA